MSIDLALNLPTGTGLGGYPPLSRYMTYLGIYQIQKLKNSETIEICGLLDPAIMNMDYFWSGSRNIRNCEVSGSINHKNWPNFWDSEIAEMVDKSYFPVSLKMFDYYIILG